MTQGDLFPSMPSEAPWPTGRGWRCIHGTPITWFPKTVCPQCLTEPGDAPKEQLKKKRKRVEK